MALIRLQMHRLICAIVVWKNFMDLWLSVNKLIDEVVGDGL